MSWSSGAELADEVWAAVVDYLPPGKQKKVARKLVKAFAARDCDTMEGCCGVLGDVANVMAMHKYQGAPKSPMKGASFSNNYGEDFVFNGKRWVYANE